MTGPSTSPRAERAGKPGATWEQQLATTETVVADDTPDPAPPNRATRRALARRARRNQVSTDTQDIEPTLGEQITELFARVASLSDQVAALHSPEWGARMGLLPEGHPLHPTPGPAPTNPAAAVEVRDPCPRCEGTPALIPRTDMAGHMRVHHPEEEPSTTGSPQQKSPAPSPPEDTPTA